MTKDEMIEKAKLLTKKYFKTIDTSKVRFGDNFATSCKFRQYASEELKAENIQEDYVMIIQQIVYVCTGHLVLSYARENLEV